MCNLYPSYHVIQGDRGYGAILMLVDNRSEYFEYQKN